MQNHLKGAVRALGAAALAGLLALGGLPTVSSAWAEDYPGGPVQIIVSYGAGGGTDRLARLLADPLSQELGQPVTVQNLPGAGGQVAATAMLREAPDGLTVVATNMPDLYMSATAEGSTYTVDDLQVVMVDLVDPRVMLVGKDSEISTLGDFVAAAKADPGTLKVSVSQGSAQELFAKWLFGELGIDVRLVGYNGGSASANAVIAGEVDATIGDDFARFNIRDQVKALLVAAEGKSPRWPEAETLTDALEPFGITPASPDFLARYGVYAVPAAFKAEHPEDYKALQEAMLAARKSASYAGYIKENGISDLSIGKPGEDLDASFKSGNEAIIELRK